MSLEKELQDIKDNLESKYIEIINRLKTHHLDNSYIFDENLTVKENKKLVEEHNSKVSEEYNEREKDIEKLFAQTRSKVSLYIAKNYFFNTDISKKIEIFCYEEYVDGNYWAQYFASIDYVCEVIKNIIDLL